MDSKNRGNKLKMIAAIGAITICSCISVNTIKSEAGPLMSRPATTATNSNSNGSNSGGFWSRLRSGLSSIRDSVSSRLSRVSGWFRSSGSDVEREIRKLEKEIKTLEQKMIDFNGSKDFLEEFAGDVESAIRANVPTKVPGSVLDTMYGDLVDAKVKLAEGNHNPKRLEKLKAKLDSLKSSNQGNSSGIGNINGNGNSNPAFSPDDSTTID